MNPLYLILLLGSLSIPLLYSIFFNDFIKHWKNFLISTSLVAIVFLIWDAIFTHHGVWSFNQDYCIGLSLLKMPIEEWLFFFIIPFCSLFIHYAYKYALPDFKLSKKTTQIISYIFIVISLVLVVNNISKAYTAINFIFLAVTLYISEIIFIFIIME